VSANQSFFMWVLHRLLCNTFRDRAGIFLILILVISPACSAKKMSVEEAKQVTVSISKTAFIPPPRRIDDILAILNQPGEFDSEVTKEMKAKVGSSPPRTNDSVTLADFYHERGNAAITLGYPKQGLADLRTALAYAESIQEYKYKRMGWLLFKLGKAEIFYGNFKSGHRFFEQSNRYRTDVSYSALVWNYAKIGDLERAKRYRRKALTELKKQLDYQQSRGNFKLATRKKAVISQAHLFYLEGQGKFAEAEKHIRTAHELWSSLGGHGLAWSIMVRMMLATNLEKQGRLVEAELEARQAFKEALGFAGNQSALTGKALNALGGVLLAQGRLKDAERLARAGVSILEDSGVSLDSQLMGDARMILGNILAARSQFGEAMRQFDLVLNNIIENQYLYNKYARNPNLLLALLQTDRVEEGSKIITSVYSVDRRFLGAKHYKSLETLALKGMSYAKMRKLDRSLEDYSRAVPLLLERSAADDDDYTKRWRLTILTEAYMDLLREIQGTRVEKDAAIDAAAEAFRLAGAIGGRTVESALGASGAREAVVNPDLADLVRKEQDALKQIRVWESSLSDMLVAPPDQQLPAVMEDLRERIDDLSRARNVLLTEIGRRFPKYSNFTNSRLVSVDEAQRLLSPGEALVFIYTSDRDTYVWAIPNKGKIEFFRVPLGEKEISRIVAHLREALDPEPGTFGDIPEFDLLQAYGLYTKLLKPVERGWKRADDLLIVTHGPLGQLPLSVLPTAPVVLGAERGELFSKYRQVPWLIRGVSITRLPSVSSLVTLRTLPQGNPSRKAFAGFGDPFFNQHQFAEAQIEKPSLETMLASRGGSLNVRGIRITNTGNLDSDRIISSHLGMLKRLPDTAEEIKSIAETLDAEFTRDVFLGVRASESQVKTMDLSDRRVVAFATHALVPGDLDGLDQPALALTSPSVSGDNGDGLLTTSEIMRLKMNADWVILSACNTGAADGVGAEAVSGLGRAFFYAGTRAILVSMWPVETSSARKLTTNLFVYQKENPKLSRTMALRKSMLELIDGPGLRDDATGKIVASYAHPLFWAPFIIVGESGGEAHSL